MAILTLTDSTSTRTVVAAHVRQVARGVWSADLTLDGDTRPRGAVTFQAPGLELRGTVDTGGVYTGQTFVRVVAGANGMQTTVASKGYRNALARTVATDLLREVGETLSPLADAALLGRLLPFWTRAAGTAADALGTLADALGATWRALDDGSVWLGVDTWPPATFEHQVMHDMPEVGRSTLASDEATLRPAVTFAGRRVLRVEHDLTKTAFRTHYEYEGTFAGVLARVARAATKHTIYFGQFTARVVLQAADGTLEIVPEDARIPPQVGVRMLTPPGMTFEVERDTRVLLGFENGDPQKPVAQLWHVGDAKSVTIKATSKVIVDAPSVELGGEGGRPLACIGDVISGALDVPGVGTGLPFVAAITAGGTTRARGR